MNYLLSSACCAVLISLLTPELASAQTDEVPNNYVALDAVAAVVNDGIVLQSELAEEIVNVTVQLQRSGTQLPPQEVLQQQVLERLVIQQIQLQRAERTGIVISDEELNETIAGLAARNGLSLSQLPESLAAEGVDYGLFRESIRKQLTVERLRQRDVLARIAVSPRELDSYVERLKSSDNTEYNISHILISIPSGAGTDEIQAAEAQVQEVLNRARAGEEFGELAVAFSDSQQALEGGLIGWRRGADLPTIFADYVPAMQIGDISEPISAGSGLHLIRLNDKRGREQILEDQMHLRHILIKTTEIKDDDTARQQLLKLRQQILDGEDFATVATAVSEDPGSAAKGGDLGWTGPGVFVPEFEMMANTLEVDEISQPFSSPFGWHIMQLLGRRTYDTTDEMQRREAIMAIRSAKFEEETELWIRRIRDEAFVEYRL